MTQGVDKHLAAISSKIFIVKSSMKHKADFETKRAGSGFHIYKVKKLELHHLKYKENAVLFWSSSFKYFNSF